VADAAEDASRSEERERRLGQALAALRIRRFAAWWGAQFLSGIGSWAQAVAIPWYVLERTNSAADVGIVTALQFLPILLLSLVGGAVADRVSRRALLLGTQLGLAALAAILGLLVALGRPPLVVVGVVAFGIGVTSALNNPAQQAFLAELVPGELLPAAVALNSVQFNAARMVGGALGGVLIAAFGVATALWANALSFLPVVVVLVALRAHTARSAGVPRRSESLLRELGSGLRYVAGETPLLTAVLIFGFVGLFGFNWQVAVPLVARFVLHQRAVGLGQLLGALGFGALAAALFATASPRATQRRLVVSGLGLAAALVSLGLAPSVLLAAVLLFAGGVFGVLASVSANTLLQTLSPPALRGRIMALYVLLVAGTTPIGAFLLGELASWLGAGRAVVVFGAATGVGILAAVAARYRWHASAAPSAAS
jgi:MFS family permease